MWSSFNLASSLSLGLKAYRQRAALSAGSTSTGFVRNGGSGAGRLGTPANLRPQITQHLTLG